MLLDASLAFVPVGSPLSCVGSTGATFYSNTIDLLGQGAGTAPQVIFGTPSVYGSADGAGVGRMRVEMAVAVGTTFVNSTSTPTINVQLQAAPDTAVTYLPGTWSTEVETGTIATANLTAGAVIMRFPWLPPFLFTLRPRYLRLAFVTPSGTNYSAGTIAYAVPTLGRDDWSAASAAKNYTVA